MEGEEGGGEGAWRAPRSFKSEGEAAERRRRPRAAAPRLREQAARRERRQEFGAMQAERAADLDALSSTREAAERGRRAPTPAPTASSRHGTG